VKKELSLQETDVRAIIRLIADVHLISGDHVARKRVLMSGLARLVGADSWAWGMAFQMAPDKPSVHLSMVHGGFGDDTYAGFTQAYNHPEMSKIHAPFARELIENRCHLTRLRVQIVADKEYVGSDCCQAWRHAEIDDVIMSMRPVDEGLFSIIGLYRKPSRPRYTRRENRIAHIVLSGIPSLHAEGWPDQQQRVVRKLTPRQRMTMDLLIQGYRRDEIAAHLEISAHTVNEYAKAVFRHFGVHSQAELSARFRTGDGGDA
jgi:DNA-binding CsgD family transcriptional regulator